MKSGRAKRPRTGPMVDVSCTMLAPSGGRSSPLQKVSVEIAAERRHQRGLAAQVERCTIDLLLRRPALGSRKTCPPWPRSRPIRCSFESWSEA